MLRLVLGGYLTKSGANNKCAMWIKNPELVFFDEFRTRSQGNDPAATSPEAINPRIQARQCLTHPKRFSTTCKGHGQPKTLEVLK